MPLLDVLKQLGLAAGQIGAQGLGAVGNAMEQQGNPAAFAASQQQQLQHAQLLQQLNLHNTMTPYEQGELDLAHATQSRLSNQLSMEQQHWQAEQNATALQHTNQVNEFLLTNADSLQKADPTDADAVNLNGRLVKMKPRSDMVELGAEPLQAIGLQLPDGASGVRLPLEKAAPILEQYRKTQVQKSFQSEAQNLAGIIDQAFADNPVQRQLAHSQLNAAMSQSDPAASRTMLDALYSGAKQYLNEYSPAAQQQKQNITRQGQIDAAKTEFEFRNPFTPQEVTQGVKALKDQGTRVLKGMNPRLQAAVRQEAAGQGVSLLDLTNQEVDNRAKANLALNLIADVRNTLAQPGVRDQLGVVGSRWNDFWTKKVGSELSPQWKTIADKTKQAQSLLTNIHYGVRGAANSEVQHSFDFANASKMDARTFETGLDNVENLLRLYSQEGAVTVQDQLGLTPSAVPSVGGTFNGGKVLKVTRIN